MRDEYFVAYAPAEKPLWVLAVFTAAEIPDFWLPCFATESRCDDACRKSPVTGTQMFESAATSEGKMIARAALLPHSYPNVAGEPVTS